MYPSCSRFCAHAIRSEGFIDGVLLTTDRLVRCCTKPYQYEFHIREDGFKMLNDFPGESHLYGTRTYYSGKKEKKPFNEITNPDNDWMLINSLIQKELFSEAIVEINRYQTTHSDISPEIYLNEINCYERLHGNDGAIRLFEHNYPLHIKENDSIRLRISELYIADGGFENANLLLAKVVNNNNPEIRRKAYSYLGVVSMENKDFDAARDYFSMGMNPQTNLLLLDEYLNVKQKNVNVAYALSIIPGAGYLYGGYTQSAIISFLTNALLGYAVYSSIKTENYGVAALFGVIGISFYIGNFRGAGLAVKRNNHYRKTVVLDKIYKENHLLNTNH